MANPNIKFFRSNVAPSNPVEGYVWFNTENRTIQLFKNGDWEVYSGLINATYDNRVLTLTNATGAKVAVDLNDIYDEIAKLEGITDKVTTYVVTAIAQETKAREEADEAINGKVIALETAVGNENSGLVKDVKSIQDELNSLSGGAGSIATQINNAISALDLPNTYEAKGEAAKAEAAAKAYADGKFQIAGNYEVAGTAAGLNEAMDARVVKLEAIDHNKLAEDAAAAAVTTVLDGAPEKFDTLKEIAAWIAEADTAEDAASLVTRVAANEEAIEDLQAGLEEAERVTAESHTNLNGRLETVETWRTGLASEYAAQDGKYIASVKQVDGNVEATYGDLPVIPDVDDMIETAIAGLDSTATVSSDYATFTVAEVDGKVVNEGSSISLTVGSLTNNTDGLAVVSDVKTYVDNAWVWGEF